VQETAHRPLRVWFRRSETRVQRELSDRLSAVASRLAKIKRRLAEDFPDYSALASPAPVSVTEVQAHLGADEALVLFVPT
jgi:hypothetical protein